MIVLPRSQARAFRAVLRRCASHADYSRDPFVLARAGPRGAALEAVLDETALRLDLPGRHDPASLTFPASLLARIEGVGDDLVVLEEIKPGRGRATWTEAGSPANQEFAAGTPDPHRTFPAVPSRLVDPGEHFLAAMTEAARTVSKERAGRNMHRVLLRADKGQIVATDGRMLLVQGGFRFPWKEDLLIAPIDAWGCREMPDAKKVGLARSGKHVFVCIGLWTFAHTADLDVRFPSYEKIIPSPRSITTRLGLSTDDIALLLKELPRLRETRDSNPHVVLDLGSRQVRVRAVAEGKEAFVLELPAAKLSGPPVVVPTHPAPLLRALKLGFAEIEVVHPAHPICCRDTKRTYVWMPLTPSAEPPIPVIPPTPKTKENSTMPNPANGRRQDEPRDPGPPTSPGDPIAEAESIRDLLGEAQTRLARLLSALKQHRRQTRAMRAAVDSLRQLPPLVP